MSIASELNALNGYILGAYDEINTKGGTVPANKNMANLASAIASISTGSSTTITPLSVTENGTYTAPTGTAYSPVTVNVSGGGGADNNWTDVINGTTTSLVDDGVQLVPDFAFMVGHSGDTSTQSNMTSTIFYKITSASFPNVESVGEYAFQFWGSATSISLPKCEKINRYAFAYCASLQTISLPSLNSAQSSTMYRTYYFRGCSSLRKADLGSNSIPFSGSNLFYQSCFGGCSNLEALVLRMPSVVGNSMVNNLTGTKIANGSGYIYVPANLIESYKTASVWSNYANQFRTIEDYSDDGTVDGDINV